MQTRSHAIGKQSYSRLLLIFLAWTAYGVFFASQSMFRRGISNGFADLPRHLFPWLLCAYCWAVLTPLVIRLTSRFPFAKNRFFRAFAVHIPAAIVFSLVQLGLYSAVASLLSGSGINLLRETMNGMEEKLDPAAFVRLRRSTIVRIDQIQELHPASQGEFEVVLKDGTTLSSSRRYRKNLQTALKI